MGRNLKPEVNLNNIQTFISHPAENTAFSISKTSRLIMLRQIITVYSWNHMKHINRPKVQNAEFILLLKQIVHIVTTVV
jgi:hypothetical protein